MSILSKIITLRIPSNIIYRALKDTRLEYLFPEFFIGIERKVLTDKINKEISYYTITKGKQIEIFESIDIFYISPLILVSFYQLKDRYIDNCIFFDIILLLCHYFSL